MIVKLSLDEYKILEKILSENDYETKGISIVNYDNYIIIKVNKYIADDIREIALDELEIIGFDINYELTKEGKIIEKLIDLFYVES